MFRALFRYIKALGYLLTGKVDAARKTLEEGIQAAETVVWLEVHDRLLLAMTLVKMGNIAAAQKEFNTARGQLQIQFPDMTVRSPSNSLNDWCRCMVAFREAEQVLAAATAEPLRP